MGGLYSWTVVVHKRVQSGRGFSVEAGQLVEAVQVSVTVVMMSGGVDMGGA